jgi:hypothetical protein
MKRLGLAVLLGVVAVSVNAPSAAAQEPNVWACHQAGDHYEPVPPEQAGGHVRHGDPTVVATDKASAEAACNASSTPTSSGSTGGSTPIGGSGGGGTEATPGGGRGLPRTGLPVWILVLSGAGLICAGAALRRSTGS